MPSKPKRAGAGKRLISSLVGKGPPPDGWEPARWKKHGENCHRAERLTGFAPITAEGWEKVAVILMDQLESKASPKPRRKLRKAKDD